MEDWCATGSGKSDATALAGRADDDNALLANQNVSQIWQFSLFSAVSRTTVVYKLLCRVYTSATCCPQHVACCPQQVARPRNLLPRNMLRWCKRGITVINLMLSNRLSEAFLLRYLRFVFSIVS